MSEFNYIPWDDLEKGADNCPSNMAPVVSIAISLKRIADLLDGTTLGVNVNETLFSKLLRP
jgi:hypothetical protein